MKTHLRTCLWLFCLLLAACGRYGTDESKKLSDLAHLTIIGQEPGVTPFIRTLTIGMDHYADVTSVSYAIAPKLGSWSKPVKVSYDKAWLDRNGAYDSATKRLKLTVFGLYADHRNEVLLTARFSDDSLHAELVPMETPAYTDAAAFYGKPTVRTARTPLVAPGADFMVLHNGVTTPVVVDSDGNLRWVGAGLRDSFSSTFVGDAFLVGSGNTTDLYRMTLDGRFTTARVPGADLTNFHHDLSPGKNGLLAEMDGMENGTAKVESLLVEVTPTGQVLRRWDLAAIFRAFMRAHGDDPSNFVIDGGDWFHMNSAFYNRADDSLIVSSRENFVVKLDYESGQIKWILGDLTKHWYVDYRSLRSVALTITQGNPPIGQHTVSVTSDGGLLLFNNGTPSFTQPPGTAPGARIPFSAPVKYIIDEQARTAAVAWTYEHDPAIVSDICSSAYQTGGDKYLVAYSVAEERTRARLIAVDGAGKVAFDYEYPTNICTTAFIASPIGFDDLSLK